MRDGREGSGLSDTIFLFCYKVSRFFVGYDFYFIRSSFAVWDLSGVRSTAAGYGQDMRVGATWRLFGFFF